MEIIELAEQDLEDLSRLYKQFWDQDSSLQKMRSTFRRLSRNPNYIFLAAKQDKYLAGSAMGIICEELYGECKPFTVIEDVIVDEDYRRIGIGMKLMRKLEKHAVDRNCNYIIFVTDSKRTDALEFYQSLGYELDRYKGFKKRLGTGEQSIPEGIDKSRL